MIELNEEQLRAVEFPHTSPAVVTAAAGSGKTTLLVERVIRLLSDRELNLRAESLAIMTFTRNATKSLREKLNSALNKRLAELAKDGSEEARTQHEYLSEQLFGLRQASISTIDAFCLKIIRENPEAFELPVSFTLADEPKKAAMQSRAIKSAMQDFYDDSLPEERAFTKEERDTLFYTFNFEDDRALQEQVISAADELSTYADAEGWLNSAVAVYSDQETLEKHYLPFITPSISLEIRRAKRNLISYENLAEALKSEADEIEANDTKGKKADSLAVFRYEVLPEIERYIAFDLDRFEELFNNFEEYEKSPSLEALSAMLSALREREEPPKVTLNRGAKIPSKTSFTTAKNALQETVENLLKISADSGEDSLPAQRTAVSAFVKLLRNYREYYGFIKKSTGCPDFSDCELLLLEKLADEEFRRGLSERFSCIIVDEFQDSNDIQAEIFKRLGNGRLFYVGDVKQSIYAFRGGNPYIMAKLCGGADGFSALPLNRNYRSRKAVIDTVNAAFSGLMTAEYGGVEYEAPENRLVFGADFLPEIEEQYRAKYDSEIVLINGKPAEENKDMLLARYAAKRIKQLHDDKDFLISKGGVLVRPKYSDFAILLRYKSKISCYRDALSELGISSAAPKGQSFLDSEEINLMLNYLAVVDDPLKDEELLKVLMSPIYRFTAEEMGELRLGILGIKKGALKNEQAKALAKTMKKYSLFNCLRICGKPLDLSEFGEEKIIARESNPRLESFMSDLNNFRYYMSSNSLYKLVCKIYEDTDAVSIVAAFEDSARRVANIRRLQELAADFESRDGASLGDFLRFIERARRNRNQNVEEAAAPEDTADSVRIMTFHGSKGLEVPVCILSELDDPFMFYDYSGTMLINRDHFLAMKQVDIKKRFKSKPLAYCALERINRKKLCGEELRLLYVAMTRAQEKLIMLAKAPYDKWAGTVFSPDEPDEIFEGSVPFRWVFGSLLRNFDPDSGRLRDVDCRIISETDDGVPPILETKTAVEYDIPDEESERLAERMRFNYKYEDDTRRRAKFSVTELAHKNSVMPVVLTKPVFAQDFEKSGADKGNAYHNCMQVLPLEEFKNIPASDYEETAIRAIESLRESGRLTEGEAELIDPRLIANFLLGELGQRMLKSPEIRREQPFYAEIDGSEFGDEELGEITVQGRIDLYFVEDGEIVVVDYKSDTVQNLEREKENYAKQVKIYSKALPALTGMAVRGIYLYAFLTSEAIKI